MKLESRVGCSTNCYHGFDLDTALKGIAKAGFKWVELTAVKDYTEHVAPERMTRGDKRKFLDKLNAYGLAPMSVSGHSNLASREGIELFKKRIDFAKDIGVGVVNTGPGEVETGDGRRSFFVFIEDIAEYAARAEVVVALETHGDMMGSGESGAQIVRRIGSPWVRLNYDTGNVIFYGGVKPELDIAAAIPYLAHVHLKDKKGGVKVWDFPPIGMGEVDFPRIFKILAESRFSGPISVEIEVLGKGSIPSWLVFDEKNEIVSSGLKHDDPRIVDAALAASTRYLKQYGILVSP
jgi:sugar phosphate isomerase/epimerase